MPRIKTLTDTIRNLQEKSTEGVGANFMHLRKSHDLASQAVTGEAHAAEVGGVYLQTEDRKKSPRLPASTSNQTTHARSSVKLGATLTKSQLARRQVRLKPEEHDEEREGGAFRAVEERKGG